MAAHILRVDRPWILTRGEAEFPDLAGEPLLQRRENHEPLAYILGYREFFGRPFTVDSAVLIPRHETETLVEAALDWIDRNPERTQILDLGTGSGILATTLKLERPSIEVTAVDLSPEAIAVASANARFHNANVRFIHSDAFASLLGESFDLIVSNPPYVAESDFLPTEVKDHEPALALWSGPTGFEFYERLAKEAPAYLEDAGSLMMEVGYGQAFRVRELFEATGWTFQEIRNDLSGVERVVCMGWHYACEL